MEPCPHLNFGGKYTTLSDSVRHDDNVGNTGHFNADVDYENLVSSRIALENMNNPRVSGLISMATNAKYVWGLEAKLESIVLDQMKTNHIDMMKKF